MQALEHLHSLRKTQHKHACNHKNVGSLGKFRKDGTQSVTRVGFHDTMLSRTSVRDSIEQTVMERTEKTTLEGERKLKREAKKGANH